MLNLDQNMLNRVKKAQSRGIDQVASLTKKFDASQTNNHKQQVISSFMNDYNEGLNPRRLQPNKRNTSYHEYIPQTTQNSLTKIKTRNMNTSLETQNS